MTITLHINGIIPWIKIELGALTTGGGLSFTRGAWRQDLQIGPRAQPIPFGGHADLFSAPGLTAYSLVEP
jgi:hypothetical protein